MSDNIKVVVKVRPLISREVEEKLSYRWRVKTNTITQLDQNGLPTDQCFTFDKVYDKDTKTKEVYDDIAKPIVEAAIHGFNGTIFAYGQTSSGKTYTMSGTEESPGIIPLAVLNLFEMIKEKKDRDFLVRVSYMEIYNETLRDLLNVEKKDIKIRDTWQGGVKVECTEKVTGSPEEVLEAMKEGEANRQTGATNMNEESSRSHSIFQITIESREHIEGEESEGGSVNVSQLNLVDLAGSERAGQTGATGLRFREGTHINKSLSTLALVIKQLSEEQKHMNYRDSKLTRILQNSLGGNAKTSIICAITPASVEETSSTLQFANRAKSIKNTPEVNAVATSATMIQSLTKELSRLQSELAEKRNLEVQLETKKNVEQELQSKIATLQKLILNGFGARSGPLGARRQLPAPRRVTISALHHVERDPPAPPPKFCTPSLKYNPMQLGIDLTPAQGFASGQGFAPIQSCGTLAPVPEEARLVTPPPGLQTSSDVIDITSDDEGSVDTRCSPYHKCFSNSKTPPCVLRKNAKTAEKNLKDIVELTQVEKMYTPSVVELIQKLDEKTNIISQLQEEISSLKEQSEQKDSEIEVLKTKIEKTEEEVKNIGSVKLELEVLCKKNSIKLTDWEVSYETLAKKFKTREQELLSLLAEQQTKQTSGIPKKMESEMNFMDMSKDISLVNSDQENSAIDDGCAQVQELLTSIHAELKDKQSTTQLESDLYAQQQKIESLENSSRQLAAKNNEFKDKLVKNEIENSLLKTTVENLNSIIDKQRQHLDTAGKDIESYNSTIQELQIQLSRKDNVVNITVNDQMLDTMIANEQKVIANNDNIKNIIHSFKEVVEMKNKEIDILKSAIDSKESSCTVLKEQSDIKDAQINTLIEEMEEIKEQLSENISVINKLMLAEQDLNNQVVTLQNENDSLKLETNVFQKEIHENTTKLEKMQEELSNAEAQILQQQDINANLQIKNDQLIQALDRKEDNESSKLNRIESLEQQNDNLLQKVADLENHVSKSKLDNEHLDHSLKEKERVIYTMSCENKELSNQVEDMAQRILQLESDLNIKEQLLLSSSEKVALVNNVCSQKSKHIIQKIDNVILKLAGDSEENPEFVEDISEILNLLESRTNALVETISGFQTQVSNLAELEKVHSNVSVQNEKLSQEAMQLKENLQIVKAELENKHQNILQLEEKLSNALLSEIPTEINQGDLDMAIARLHKLHNIILRLSPKSEELPVIDSYDKLYQSFDGKLSILDCSLTQILQSTVELQDNLLKITDDKESDIANLESQIAAINKEMENQTRTLSTHTAKLIEDLQQTKTEFEFKAQEVIELEIKLNDAKENNENLRNDLICKDNSITLLHEKLTSLYSQIESLRNEIESLKNDNANIPSLENLVKEKCAQVQRLEAQNQRLEDQLSSIATNLEQKYEGVTNALDNAIINRDKLLAEILRKAVRVARQCGIVDDDLTENHPEEPNDILVYEHVVLTLDRIGMNIALLKTENDVERSDIEKMLTDAKEEIEKLVYQNINLKTDYECLEKKYHTVLLETEYIKNLSSDENENNTTEQVNLNTMETENLSLKAPIMPQKLSTLCCNRIFDAIQINETEQPNINANTSIVSIQPVDMETQTVQCDCQQLSIKLSQTFEENAKLVEDLDKATAENLQLADLLKDLQDTTDYLLEEREAVRKEIQMIMEPACELQKKISNHKTNLSTLTATTYAENKLLHSQLKVLKHHYTRYTNVCQRDLPVFKSQLHELMAILKGSSFADKQNNSFKRYSLPNVLDSSSTSAFKNESTLDGDLLMLDTNITVTSNDNTLVGPDQTCLEVTQTNFDANDTTCQNSNESKIIDPYLVYTEIETLSNNNQKLNEFIKHLEQENLDLKEKIKKSAMSTTDFKNAQCSPVKIVVDEDSTSSHFDVICEHCDTIKEKLNDLQEKFETLKEQKDSLQIKYDNLNMETPSTEVLIRKLSNTEKDNAVKIQEINKLTKDLQKKIKTIKDLQNENDTLSVQVMDNISEADSLKKELDQLKDVNSNLVDRCNHLEKLSQRRSSIGDFTCSQCVLKDDIIKSLQLEHSKLNRSLSDSESSSRHNKICTLQSELHASKEDCKTITEEVATIKNHLERNNTSICQAMDLDETMEDSSIFVLSADINRAEENKTNASSYQMQNLYTYDKRACFDYYVNKIGTGKENLEDSVKIIDIMTALYNNLIAKHGDEVENLSNKLRDFEEEKRQLQIQFNDITAKHSKLEKQLIESQQVKTKSVLEKIKDDISVMNQEMNNVLGIDRYTKTATFFKDNILRVFDSEFNMSCVNIFESIIENLVNKNQKDLSEVMDQYTNLQSQLESVVMEYNTTKENLQQINRQLLDKENEYNLLKAQKEKIHEINSSVTLDIVNKEKELIKILANEYDKLVELKVLNPYEMNLNLPYSENLKIVLDNIVFKRKQDLSDLEQANQMHDLQIRNLKSILDDKEKMLTALEEELSENQKIIHSQKLLQDDLSKLYENKVDENKSYLKTIDKLNSEITVLKNEIAANSAKQDKSPNEKCQFCAETFSKIQDYANLKITLDMITKEKDVYASEVEKSREIIAKNKTELDRMTSDILVLRESVDDNVSIIEKLSQEAKSLMEQNLELKNQFDERKRECSRLEMNIKTHEKTAEIQNKMIIRLQKQKQEDEKSSKEKDRQLDELTDKYAALQVEFNQLKDDLKSAQEEFTNLKNKKDSLEEKVVELERNLTQEHKRKSIDAIADASRRRRQSLHDTKRCIDTEIDELKVEAVFSSRTKPDDLFMDVDDDSSNRSTPLRLSVGRDSLLRHDHEEELSRPSSVEQTRRRRQSIHDQHRMRHTPSPHDSFRTEAKTSENTITHLREQLASTQLELEDLKEKYRELDDECETCAQYLRERDEQCRKLRKEKIALEARVTEMRDKITKKDVSDVAVNTDENWANLHSVVVDRMSFDAEVEKNKKLSRTIEELRCNKQELKNTVAKMQKALERNAAVMHSKELDSVKAELSTCKRELLELQERYRELDEECETCAQYLRERDEQCRKLREANNALEKRLEELSGESSAASSARRRRQSAYDMNRDTPARAHDVTTEIGDELLSMQVERDSSECADTPRRELQRLRKKLENLSEEKAQLENQLRGGAPTMYVATGSAIVQSQQITEVMKENQKLKKINAKLVQICKKRGKPHDRENQEPAPNLA